MSPMIVIARVSSRHTRTAIKSRCKWRRSARRQPRFPTIYIQIVNKRFYCCFTVARHPAVPSARIRHIVNNLLLYNCIASCQFGGLDFHERRDTAGSEAGTAHFFDHCKRWRQNLSKISFVDNSCKSRLYLRRLRVKLAVIAGGSSVNIHQTVSGMDDWQIGLWGRNHITI